MSESSVTSKPIVKIRNKHTIDVAPWIGYSLNPIP